MRENEFKVSRKHHAKVYRHVTFETVEQIEYGVDARVTDDFDVGYFPGSINTVDNVEIVRQFTVGQSRTELPAVTLTLGVDQVL